MTSTCTGSSHCSYVSYSSLVLGKYLYRYYNLRDDCEIITRIKKGYMQYGALREVLNNKKGTLKIKVFLYISIIQNTVLWGNKSWSISSDSQRRLQVFQTKMIRYILGININMVQTYRITNA